MRDWLAADADPRTTADPTLADGVRCDAIGCTARLVGGSIVALALAPDAFEEDCRRAALVVSSRNAPANCAAAVVDRTVRTRAGAMMLRRVGDGWETIVARPAGTDRPWAPALPAPHGATGETPLVPRQPARRIDRIDHDKTVICLDGK